VTEPPPLVVPAGGSRRRPLRVVRAVLVVVVLGFLVIALASRWSQVRGELGRVDPAAVLLAFGCVLGGGFCTMMAWRALLADLGSHLSLKASARVLFLGQLAKYVPGGGVWAAVAQTELARDFHVPRKRAAVAALVYAVMTLAVATLVALLAVPRIVSGDAPTWLRWTPLLAVLGLLGLLPPVLTKACALLFRLLRREPLDRAFSWRGAPIATGWLALSYVLYGLQIYVLAVDLGAPAGSSLLPAVGSFAAAWAAGFLVMVIPTGGGTRELVLTLALAAQLPGGTAAALTVAVVSRLLMTASDVVTAGLGAALRPAREPVPAAD
jgi:uncharacterized membrane protein YbhN (UPF0104 family)